MGSPTRYRNQIIFTSERIASDLGQSGDQPGLTTSLYFSSQHHFQFHRLSPPWKRQRLAHMARLWYSLSRSWSHGRISVGPRFRSHCVTLARLMRYANFKPAGVLVRRIYEATFAHDTTYKTSPQYLATSSDLSLKIFWSSELRKGSPSPHRLWSPAGLSNGKVDHGRCVKPTMK